MMSTEMRAIGSARKRRRIRPVGVSGVMEAEVFMSLEADARIDRGIEKV